MSEINFKVTAALDHDEIATALCRDMLDHALVRFVEQLDRETEGRLFSLLDAKRGVVSSDGDRGQRDQMTLGGLILALGDFDPDLVVAFDDGRGHPSPEAFHSYRGYYDRLAIEAGDVVTQVHGLLKQAEQANGSIFEGYKGGLFRMDLNTEVYAADWGDCGRQIVGVVERGGVVVLETQEEVW